MVDIQRIRVLDAPVDVINMETALAFVDDTVAAREPGNYVLAMNPEKTFALRRDRQLGDFFEDAALLLPDGIGVVLAARFLHGARIGRVPGADFMQEICRHASEKGYRVFIYGATEEVNVASVAKLKQRYPGLQIAGRANGYVSSDAMEALVDEINDSEADILFVALGSPRQENWMRDNGPGLKVPLCLGIGGTLDTVVGKVKRAPKVFQRLGLEWFYRLMCQPSRIGRQKVLPLFALQVAWQKLSAQRSAQPNHTVVQFARLLTLLYWIVLSVLLVLPKQSVEAVADWVALGSTDDFAVHLCAFALLAVMTCACRIPFRAITVISALCGYAVLAEAVQAFSPGRCATLSDAAANLLGVAGGLLVVSAVNMLRARQRELVLHRRQRKT